MNLNQYITENEVFMYETNQIIEEKFLAFFIDTHYPREIVFSSYDSVESVIKIRNCIKTRALKLKLFKIKVK